MSIKYGMKSNVREDIMDVLSLHLEASKEFAKSSVNLSQKRFL
jgi:hypothetical protein